jgi:hypothetical protein
MCWQCISGGQCKFTGSVPSYGSYAQVPLQPPHPNTHIQTRNSPDTGFGEVVVQPIPTRIQPREWLQQMSLSLRGTTPYDAVPLLSVSLRKNTTLGKRSHGIHRGA